MNSNWKWKVWSIVTAIVLSVYALVPTLFGFPKLREDLEAQTKPIPWFIQIFPEKGLNLGLDLRGGIYVEMEVLVEEGIKSKLDLLGQEMTRTLKEAEAEPSSFSQAADHASLEFNFTTPEQVQTALRKIEKSYRTLFKRSDVVGGTSLHLILDPQYSADLRKNILSQALQAVRNRIDRYGLAEPTVQRQGETRIVIELPGVQDPDRALKIIQQAGKLEFRLVNTSVATTELGNKIAEARKENNLVAAYSFEDMQKLNEVLKSKIPEKTEIAFEIEREPTTGRIIQTKPYLLDETSYITGDMLKEAQVQFDPRSSEPYVSLSFNATGAKNFGDLTKAHVHDMLAILLDGNVMSAPQIREPIMNGECRIDLGRLGNRDQTLKEAKDLALVLQEGALPARLKEATKSVIGPTLGQDSIDKSLQSMLIASLIVIIFMMIYYHLSGLLANLALILNTLFTFALLAMFQATLTLPGMAGIVLSIGMAVDTNILIFERIREELFGGRSPRESVAAGYSNAMRAIIDTHLTTIISGIILYQFGTGPIRGFAVTLIIGLVVNLFTAVVMTRTIYDYFVIHRRAARISI